MADPSFVAGRGSECHLLDRFAFGKGAVLNPFGPGSKGRWPSRARGRATTSATGFLAPAGTDVGAVL